MPAPFQLSKSNRVSREAGGSAPGTPRSREETLTFRESLARIENKVTRGPGGCTWSVRWGGQAGCSGLTKTKLKNEKPSQF